MRQKNYKLKNEAVAFDKKGEERISMGYIPDLRRLQVVDGLYNNPWREPEFVDIQIRPNINFIINIARKAGGRVLELGCGMGYLSLEMARYGLHVDAVDISPKSIEISKTYLKENPYVDGFGSLNYIIADITSMDMGEDKYNSIISYGTLHHIPELEPTIGRIRKALKSRGNLILYEPLVDNFTKKSAEFAAILRVVLPTWESYEKKLIYNREAWEHYVQEIYNEYRYIDQHGDNIQSPLDNINPSEERMIQSIKRYLKIEQIDYCNAFIDKIVGGLRGPNRIILAKFLKFLDDELIRRNILPPGSVRIWAIKEN